MLRLTLTLLVSAFVAHPALGQTDEIALAGAADPLHRAVHGGQ